MQSLDDIRAKIIELVTHDLGWQDSVPEGDLSEHLDSIQKFSMVVAIEDHYEICFEPEEGEQIIDLDGVAKLVQKKLKER